jgi:hypothetical protein
LTKDEYDSLLKRAKDQTAALRLAARICDLHDNAAEGVTTISKLLAVNDILRVAKLRFDGIDAKVYPPTETLVKRALVDVEVRLLWDRLGLKEWRPA